MPEEKCPEAARVQRETTGPCYWELGFHVQLFTAGNFVIYSYILE